MAKDPAEIRRSFEGEGPTKFHHPKPIAQRSGQVRNRIHKDNLWPRKRLDYSFLERCKEFICRVPRASGFMKHMDTEYRVSVIPWSRGSYIDIRMYRKNSPTGVGMLLHIDIASAILPDIVAAVRRAEELDTREPEQKTVVEV